MTLKDVAALAGCSVATVSKALKNSPEISEAVKARIVAVAKESGYLKKATTHCAILGGMKTVLLSDPQGAAVSRLRVVQASAKKQGLILLYVSLSAREARELMMQIGAMGLLLVGGAPVREERVFTLSEDLREITDFLQQIGAYQPKRPSRAGQAKKLVNVEAGQVASIPEPPTKKEEIWLL